MTDTRDFKVVDAPEEVEHDPRLVELLEHAIRGIKQGRIETVLIMGCGPDGRTFTAHGALNRHCLPMLGQMQVVNHELICLAEQLSHEIEGDSFD